MSAISKPPILQSFLESGEFEPQILSREIAPLLDGRSMAIFLHTITSHPDFINNPNLRKDYVAVAKNNVATAMAPVIEAEALLVVARQIVPQIETRVWMGLATRADQNEALFATSEAERKARLIGSDALYRAVGERNPYLLEHLLGFRCKLASDYSYCHAVKETAKNGDLFLLQKLEGRVSQALWNKAMELAIAKGHVHIVEGLPARLFSSPNLLAAAFKAPNWRKMVSSLLPKIPPDERLPNLLNCAQQLIGHGAEKMAFFIEHTNAQTAIKGTQWGELLTQPDKKLETVRFILNPLNQIPFSFAEVGESEMAGILYYGVTRSSAREEVVSRILAQIPPNTMKQVLMLCARQLVEFRNWQEQGFSYHYTEMEFFLRFTGVRQLLNRANWREVVRGFEKVSHEQIFFCCRYFAKHQIAIPLDDVDLKSLGELLAETFVYHNWEKQLPQILHNIPPEKMRESLALCAEQLMQRRPLHMEHFLQHTEAKRLLTQDDWAVIFQQPLNADVLLFLMDPMHEISFSEATLRQLALCFIRGKCWDCVKWIMSSKRAQEDPDFLQCIATEENRTFYTNYLNVYYPLFRNQSLFSAPSAAIIIQRALEWECDEILLAFIDSPGAMQVASRVAPNKKSKYIISAELLMGISRRCSETEHPVLKERKRKVDQEIAWRGPWWKKVQVTWESKSNK